MNTTEVQKALDQMVDSIDPKELAMVLERQTAPVVRCWECGFVVKNLRGLSGHRRTHRR